MRRLLACARRGRACCRGLKALALEMTHLMSRISRHVHTLGFGHRPNGVVSKLQAVSVAKRGDNVAMKLEPGNTTEASRLYGRHFDHRVGSFKRPLFGVLNRVTPLGFRMMLASAGQRTEHFAGALQDELVSRISRKSIDLLKVCPFRCLCR